MNVATISFIDICLKRDSVCDICSISLFLSVILKGATGCPRGCCFGWFDVGESKPHRNWSHAPSEQSHTRSQKQLVILIMGQRRGVRGQ